MHMIENAETCFFCAMETEYLDCVLTIEGIKPPPKKVEAILMLTPPQSVKQLYCFLGLVQNYKDLWTRQRKMLSPLTNPAGECGHTKVTQATKTKCKPWHWDEVHQTAFDNTKTQLLKMLSWPTLTTCRDLRFMLKVLSYNSELSLLKITGHWHFSATK